MLFRDASASQQREHFGTSPKNRKKKDFELRFLEPEITDLGRKCRR
jgi:hypothetical protein